MTNDQVRATLKKYPIVPKPDESKRNVSDRLAKKLDKQKAEYRPAPLGSKNHCIECVHYLENTQAASPCRVVAGLTEADYTCDYFSAR